MDDMMKIHLLIDNERYPMTIRREDEQLSLIHISEPTRH